MARKKSNVNREYKDRLFKFLFGSPSRRSWALDLYNAMNGSHYADENALVFTTIEDVVYMGMKNDVSFLIDSTMCFLEHAGALFCVLRDDLRETYERIARFRSVRA